MKMKKWTIIPMILLLAGLATYHFVMSSKKEDKQPVLLLLETSEPDCNPVDNPCMAGDAQHTVTLHFPEDVAYLKPFKMRVTPQGFENEMIEQVIVDFKMVGMDMGLNRFKLSSDVDEKGNVYYEGEGILPVCVSGRVDWSANTQIITTHKLYQATFEFKVGKKEG
jgi:hypothetical protein